MNQLSKWSPQLLSVLRAVTAFLFIWHGTMKIFNFPVPDPNVIGPMPPLIVIAGWLEVVGGSLLLVGWFTRAVAFVLSGMMAFAYFIAHAPQGFFPALNMGDAAVLFCFVFLYLAAAGGGPWSVDAYRDRREGSVSKATNRIAP